MKKLMIMAAVIFSCMTAYAQDEVVEENGDESILEEVAAADDSFPYAGIVTADYDKLISQKFKYDAKKNQLRLNHTNAIKAAANVFTSADVPANKDYTIIVQYGKNNQIAYVEVTFYDKKLYKSILNFAATNQIDVKTTKVDELTAATFEYGEYKMSLRDEYVEQSVTRKVKDKKTQKTHKVTEDRSFNRYVYVVSTGVAPSSQYLDELARKGKKGRKSKGAENLF